MKRKSENSIALRLSIGITVLIAILSILREESWPESSFWIVGLTVFGFWVSHVRRDKKNWWIRLLLAIAMVIVGYQGISGIVNSPFDPRIALTTLLMQLQVIHGFDMPARKDLNYSVLVSFVLMALAAVFSDDLVFGVFLFLYLAALTVSFFLLAYRESEEKASSANIAMIKIQKLSGLPLAVFSGTMLIGLFFFLFFPRFQGMGAVHFMPMSFQFPKMKLFQGNVMNPGYPAKVGGSAAPDVHRKIVSFNPDSYFGFNPYLDLSERGKLSPGIVMKVKSQEPGYWRGLAFDRYSGNGWSITDEKPEALTVVNSSIDLDNGDRPAEAFRPVLQSFSITHELPNLIFSMYQPATVYFPSSTLYRDSDETLRIPFYLEPGTVYTVMSRHPRGIADKLEADAGFYPDWIKKRYLQLPPELPRRVKRLAGQITQGKNMPLEKIDAIIAWLHQYPYSLNIPPPPEGQDAVDHFLFDLKKGFCEQFASSLAVLARASGVPARLVTGYATGKFNPFTLSYEVRGTDAHAWVEIYFNNLGWVPFDASPAYSEFPFSDHRETESPFLAMLKYLNWSGFKIPALNIHGGNRILAFGFLGLTLLLLARLVHREATDLQKTEALFRRFERYWKKKGYHRKASETPLEFAAKLPAGKAREMSESFITGYLDLRYSGRTLNKEQLESALRHLTLVS